MKPRTVQQGVRPQETLSMSAAAAEKSDDAISPNLGPNIALSVAQIEITAAAAEPPWPTPQNAHSQEWERLGRYLNDIAAHIVAGRLEVDGVPTIVESTGVFPGIEGSFIWIPKELAHRARWILAWPALTENELTFLATGELVPVGDNG